MEMRTANAADADMLAKLRVEFLLELGSARHQEASLLYQSLVEYYTGALASGECIGLVGTMPEGVVCCAVLSVNHRPPKHENPTGLVGHISNVYTRPGHRGQGYASEITRQLMDVARRRGITSFELTATQSGRGVYERLGFKVYPNPYMCRNEG